MRSFYMIGRVGALLTALAACGGGGDGPTEPVSAANSMSFTYSGAVSGSFSVSGIAGPQQSGTVAVKFDGPPNLFFVGGVSMRSATHADMLELVLPAVTAPRTFSLADECGSSMDDCPLAFFAMNVEASLAGNPGDSPFIFTSGSVNVTSLSDDRIAGTFQGTAETLEEDGTSRRITVANGKFDVAITSFDDF